MSITVKLGSKQSGGSENEYCVADLVQDKTVFELFQVILDHPMALD